MTLFRQKGYEAATVDELAEAMEITPPSLYTAFGSKEGLFMRVFQHYLEHQAAFFRQALGAPTAYEVAARILRGMIGLSCVNGPAGGCLVTQTVAVLADPGTKIGRTALATCQGAHQALTVRFEKARADGDLAPETNPETLARFLYTLAQGISIQAVGGARQEQLLAVVEMALRLWPSPKRE